MSRLSTTVCIVGGGPAGITLALELNAAGVDTIVLESGSYSPEPWSRDQAVGQLVGGPLRFGGQPIRLDQARLRQLGGSSGHWSGMCRPLDPIDFERTPPGTTGWPLRFDDLVPWYRLAQQTCELGPFEYGASHWFARESAAPVLDTERWRTVIYQFSPPTRFGERYREALAASPSAQVILGASVLELRSTKDGKHITGATAGTASGRRLEVGAEIVVLAAGGIDVARLMLVSRSARPEGLGNGNDLVGRYFMDHPHVPIGHALLTAPPERLALHRLEPRPAPAEGPSLVWAAWAPTPALVAAGEVPQATVAFSTAPVLPRGDQSVEQEVSALLGLSPEAVPVELVARMDCDPRPERRVSLSGRRDVLGVARPRLHWAFTAKQAAQARSLARSFARELGRTGLGRFRHAPGYRMEVGNHHMGTTRMGDDPAHSVVDRDCLVHGIDNLYVAGSAVFPTSGCANPTLTIVALAHRLGRRLVEVLGNQPSPGG